MHVYVHMCTYTCTCALLRTCFQMQRLWLEYVRDAGACCSNTFWSVFQSVQGQSIACRDKVMHVVKEHIPQDKRGRWASTTRTLRSMVARQAGDFWSNVTVTRTIDLSAYNLPGCTSVTFSFMDPVYIWIERCNALHSLGLPLEWDAGTLRHPDTGEEVYGAGIQYSEILRKASANIPREGKIALFNVNWDGGGAGFGSRSAVPICVQVMNTNSMHTASVGLVGYLPYVEVFEGYKQHKDCKAARIHVLQVSPSSRARTCYCTCTSTCTCAHLHSSAYTIHIIVHVCIYALLIL